MSNRLLNYLSSDSRKSKIYIEILNPVNNQIDLVETDIKDVNKQLFIDTATWGLNIYEKELGINTVITKSLEERRSVIKSKIRGYGTVNTALIKIVTDSYTNGDVDVSFDGKINIKYNSGIGIPSNLEDLEQALEDIKPAHLRIAYQFAYLLIRDIHDVMTINEIEQTPLSNFAGGI